MTKLPASLGCRRLHYQTIQSIRARGPRPKRSCAAIRATTRPAWAGEDDGVIAIRALTISKEAHKCTLNGKELALTPLEFNILWYLCKKKGAVVSSEELFEAVWGEKILDQNNTVMAHIARLREKLHEPPGGRGI